MQRESRGGLVGKARKTHRRSRAARAHAQQLIEDYLAPKADPEDAYLNRKIPIGHSYEFAPSVIPENEEIDSRCIGDVAAEVCTVGVTADMLESPGVCLVKPGNGPVVRPKADKALVRGVLDVGGPPARRLRKERTIAGFTFRGFLCGCAVGAAVAALALLIFQLTLG